jgi:hypothetical protein
MNVRITCDDLSSEYNAVRQYLYGRTSMIRTCAPSQPKGITSTYPGVNIYPGVALIQIFWKSGLICD